MSVCSFARPLLLTLTLFSLSHFGAAQTWTSIGPAPLDSAYTGRITAVAVDPSDANHWLLGGATGGIWESHDGGQTWASRTDDQPTLATGAIAFAPSSPMIVYVGTGECGFSRDAYSGLGLLKSADGGTTWTLMKSPNLVQASVTGLRVNPTDPNTLIATTSRGNYGRYTDPMPSPPEYGVLRSTDGGNTWTLTLSGEITEFDVDPTNFDNQYAAIGDPNQPASPPAFPSARPNGVYRSTDGGLTWTFINGPWTSMAVTTGRISLAVAPSQPATLYASIGNPTLPNSPPLKQGLLGLFRTDDALDPSPTWIQIPTDVTGPQGYCGRQCGSAHHIAVDPADPNHVAAAGQDLWLCAQCGLSPQWTGPAAFPHPDHRMLVWRQGRLISANDGGLVSTTDSGGTWQIHTIAIQLGQFFNGDLDPTDPNFILGGLKDNVCSIWTGGQAWPVAGPAYHHNDISYTTFSGACEGEVAISTAQPKTDWMSSADFPQISRTLDGGQTAPAAVDGITEPLDAVTPPVRKCPRIDDDFLTGDLGLWRTNNFFSGATVSWSSNAPPLGSKVRGIAFAPSDASCNTYAYGTASGQVRMTTDGGTTWIDLDPGKTLPARGVDAVTFDPSNANILYLGVAGFNPALPGRQGHLFKTTNALASPPTWVDIGPPPDVPYEVVAIDPSNSKSVFLGTDAGLWYSADAGSTWQQMGPSSGMPNVPVYDIKLNRTTQRAVAFTFGRGAFMLNGLGFQPPPVPPSITSVVHGATYISGGLVPGSWGAITGTNLSSVKRVWNNADFAGLGNALPTNLSGVQVQVNGVPAAVYYISQTQINFQVPSGILPGPAGYILTSGPVPVQSFLNGVPSNIMTVTGISSSPGIFPITANGVNYAAAVFTDGNIAGDPSLGPGFRNAKPGDLVQLFVTGLFRTTGGVLPTPQSFSGVILTIGSISVPADSATLVAVGEFQINFHVPQQFANMPTANYPISVSVQLSDGNVISSPASINSIPSGPVVLPIQP
jgi:uncharacterized protein (TIGR03437 family)